MSGYAVEIHENCVKGQSTSIVNLTPQFVGEEKKVAKKEIEERLYEIFCKYVKKTT